MNLKNKIEEIELIYGIFNYYIQNKNHRDFTINILDARRGNEYNLLIKGVVSHTYTSNIKCEGFKMDEKYLSKSFQGELDAWHWGIEEFEILNYEFIENTVELSNFRKMYNNYKFYKLVIDISTAKLEFVFHDLEIEKI